MNRTVVYTLAGCAALLSALVLWRSYPTITSLTGLQTDTEIVTESEPATSSSPNTTATTTPEMTEADEQAMSEDVPMTPAVSSNSEEQSSDVPALSSPTVESTTSLPRPTETADVQSFIETFSKPFLVPEAESISASVHPHWWVSSGGYLISQNGVGRTITGALSRDDAWYQNYRSSNPLDTDKGLHPQNIFRLVQTDFWKNSAQTAAFKVVGTNYSSSINRNASNGLLFFVHYQDEFNLYYAGIRVDGAAVIKKKIDGTYYTLALEPIFADGETYRRSAEENFLPSDTWLKLRSTVRETDDGQVTISLFIDEAGTGLWRELVSATDDGRRYGGPAFTAGHSGIRTDFMDVQFDDYSITTLD